MKQGFPVPPTKHHGMAALTVALVGVSAAPHDAKAW